MALVLDRVFCACVFSRELLTAAFCMFLAFGVDGALGAGRAFGSGRDFAFALSFAFVLAFGTVLPFFAFLRMVLDVVFGDPAFAFFGRDVRRDSGPGLGLYF